MSLLLWVWKARMPRKNIKKKLLEIIKKTKILNVDNSEENVCEKIIAKHNDNIDMNQKIWYEPKNIMFWFISCIITFEFNQFERACYKHKLIWFI